MNASDLLVREPTFPISALPAGGGEMPTGVRIYTDGSILKNPGGVGGWAIVIVEDDEVMEVLSGGVPESTNNLMELRAVEEALKEWMRPDPIYELVEIISDSQYVVRGLTEWIEGWKRRGWHKVKNIPAWKRIDALYNPEFVTMTWVRGHDGDRFNELADQLAGDAARRLRDA